MTKHEFDATAICPVDGSVDRYQVTVQTVMDVHVEKLIAAAKMLADKRIIQEEFTRQLFAAVCEYGVILTTVGTHSGVRTTCVMPICNWGR